jgi:hypothetical protein
MPPTLTVKSADAAIKCQREEAAQAVQAHFGNRLPEVRLLCFFDDEDWSYIKTDAGASNRGFYTDPRRGGLLCPPIDLVTALHTGSAFTFDRLIYLHGSTCSRTISLTMTFAHELQHFVQESCHPPEVWADNHFVTYSLRDLFSTSDLEGLGITSWFDVPFEREANIISKRAAEGLLGVDTVSQYIDENIAEARSDQDVANWRCMRDLPSTSPPSDVANETTLLVQRIRTTLERRCLTVQWDAGANAFHAVRMPHGSVR